MKIIFTNRKKAILHSLAFLFAITLFSAVSVSAQLINELDINPPSTDQPCEYIELKGTPGASLAGLYFVAFEGDGVPSGTADYVFAFTNQTFGSNGLLIITGATACGTRTYPAATTRIQDTALDSANGLENGSISFALINSSTAITQGTDYDTNNDGSLESLPAGATILDAVGWTDGGTIDFVYGGVTLSTTGTIGAATRFPTNNTPLSVFAWYAGFVTGATNDSTVYGDTARTTNFPAGGALTPGDVNVGTQTAPADANVDFNGDSKSDWVITRAGGGSVNWFTSINGSGSSSGVQWGSTADLRVPADYDGDGKDDFAVWRPVTTGQPSGNAFFYILQSQTNTVRIEDFGQNGDDPRVVGDYDGDGRDDIAVYRKSVGQNFFYYRASSNNPNGNITFLPWGSGTLVRPNYGDYDGDGKADFCVYNESGLFSLLKSGGGIEYVTWGQGTSETLVPGDFDGDRKDDFCVVRTSGGNYNWFILERDGGGTGAAASIFGLPGDIVTPGDYNSDGRQDISVWRPTNGTFYVLFSGGTTTTSFQWGTTGDNPEANWYVHNSGAN